MFSAYQIRSAGLTGACFSEFPLMGLSFNFAPKPIKGFGVLSSGIYRIEQASVNAFWPELAVSWTLAPAPDLCPVRRNRLSLLAPTDHVNGSCGMQED
ncbi:hypothetical protein GCM10018781_73290 [Kitasatospora indigofera]|uniref:Uncharacterized protein n=1 Tax=Kitasatospora indigofera TaxID=67307 RepID=A0A919L585_9ACTN|nr:hypothetical protein GCM10018781_73290 [Kitasatospora indigofera]